MGWFKRCKHEHTHIERVSDMRAFRNGNGIAFDSSDAVWYNRTVCNNCGKVLKKD